MLRAERSSYHYRGKGADQADLKQRIKEIAETRVRYGYRRIHDQLATGSKLRILTVVDTFSRFSPAVVPRFRFRAPDVVEVLERVCAQVGYPASIRADNVLCWEAAAATGQQISVRRSGSALLSF